jgi:hypothetical protein
MRLMGLLLALAIAGPAAQSQTQQRDARVAAPAPPAGTAALSGIVVSSTDNARQVRQAAVVIIGTTTGVLKVTSTDANGRFAFTGLPADRYLVGASKPPYLGAVAGAKRPARPGTPVALANGQTINNVTIQLPPGSAISGTVTDERGQPAANVVINLMQGRMQNGERVLTMAPGGYGTATDERGRYRIYGLSPGEYVVVASPRAGGFAGGVRGVSALSAADVDAALKAPAAAPMSPAASAPGAPVNPTPSQAPTPASPPAPSVSYAMVFYPGTTRASDAGPLVLGVGEDRQNVDFRLELVRTAKIEGSVSGMDILPAGARVLLSASSQVGGGSAGITTVISISGVVPEARFTLPNRPPGTYTLVATASAGATASFFAIGTVEVAGTDQSGIQLVMQPALSFPARVEFAGTATAPPLAGYRVPVRALPPVIYSAPVPTVPPTNPAGAFTVTGVMPGRYVIGGPLFLGANSSSMTWSLASVTVDGRDVTDLPVDIGPTNVPKDVVITYGDQSQELSGRLQQSSGTPATDYTIVVFPADKAYWIPGSRRILTTRSGTDGQFRLGGPGFITLPAGDYLLAAVSEIDKDEQFDPAFLTSLQPAAVRVTVKPGEKKTQNLSIR